MSWDEAYGPHGRNHGQDDLEAIARGAQGGLFEGSLFIGRRGMGGGGLGALPAGADTIASTLSRWRGQFPTIPPNAELSSKGATHYTTRVIGSGVQEFTFYTSSGQVAVGPLRIQHRLVAQMPGGGAPVEPDTSASYSWTAESPAYGAPLRPNGSEPQASSGPNWLPWALVSGGVLVAGAIVWAASRKPKGVAANRKRRRRRTTR